MKRSKERPQAEACATNALRPMSLRRGTQDALPTGARQDALLPERRCEDAPVPRNGAARMRSYRKGAARMRSYSSRGSARQCPRTAV